MHTAVHVSVAYIYMERGDCSNHSTIHGDPSLGAGRGTAPSSRLMELNLLSYLLDPSFSPARKAVLILCFVDGKGRERERERGP